MKDEPLNRILLAAVIILAIGEIYLLYTNTHLRHAASVINPAGDTTISASASSTTAAVPPSTMLMPLSGEVQSAQTSRIVLVTGSSTADIVIDPSTTFTAQGAMKDSAQQADDMEAFRRSSMVLAEDAAKNKTTLQTLIAPSPYVETKINAADIAPGSRVVIYATIIGGMPHAFRVVVLPTVAR